MNTDQANAEKPRTILDLYLSWTDEQREEGVAAMSYARIRELYSALLSAGFAASALRTGFSATEVPAAERAAEKDIKSKAKLMGREESAFVLTTLQSGLLDGSSYGSSKSCGCFLGTAARKAGLSVELFCEKFGIAKSRFSPAESWFVRVLVGDTPYNNYSAKMAAKWIEEAISEMQ
jgi:hypothetical protein